MFGLREDKELMPLDSAVRMVWDKRTRVCKYLQRHVKEFKESHILLPEDKQFCNLFPILNKERLLIFSGDLKMCFHK